MSNYPPAGNQSFKAAESEHIGPDTTGDNIHAKKVAGYKFDGTGWYRDGLRDNMAMKITVEGSNTYIAKALPGTDQSVAAWQVKKITANGGDTTFEWADGDSDYDNIATDLTALTYL